MTGIAVPKYYNPAAVNPLKYAEQVQKRKLLWSKAKDHKEVTICIYNIHIVRLKALKLMSAAFLLSMQQKE